MFARKTPVLFIDRNYLEPGIVTGGATPTFVAGEAALYVPEQLGEALSKLTSFFGKNNIRIVLSETLVYVTTLEFPAGTKLTREVVRARAEEVIPEDLQTSDWDYRTLQYIERQKAESPLLVQVAVLERIFAQTLEAAIQAAGVRVVSIVPESCLLASFEAQEKGMVVLVEQNRESFVLVAAEQGLVLATEAKEGLVTKEDIEHFLNFLSVRRKEKVAGIFFSRVDDAKLVEQWTKKGLRAEMRWYNPLVGAVYEKIAGLDEQVLNLSFEPKKHAFSWVRKILFR